MERTDRLNSLLKEVLSDVIRKDVHHLPISNMLVITRVEITKDLHNAKVFISVMGDEATKNRTLDALQGAASQIGHIAARKVVLRFFPRLTFLEDEGIENQMRVQELLNAIEEERSHREPPRAEE